MRLLVAIATAVLCATLVAPEVIAANRVEHGAASTYGDGYAGFLALPEGPGVHVKICNTERPPECIERVSNDAGPSLAMQRQGRIVDLNKADFENLCDCRWRTVGLIKVSVEYLDHVSVRGRVSVTPPPTDLEDNNGVSAFSGSRHRFPVSPFVRGRLVAS